MGTPALQLLSQKYRWQPATPKWHLRWGKPDGMKFFMMWDLILILDHVRTELNCETPSSGPQRIGQFLVVEQTHTFGVRIVI